METTFTGEPANSSHRGASIMLLFEPVRVFLQTRGLLQQARSAAGHGGQWSLPRLSRRRVSAAKRGRERASGLWAWCPIRLRKCRTGPPDRGREIQLPETGFRPSPRRSSAESKAEGRSAFRVWKCRPGRHFQSRKQKVAPLFEFGNAVLADPESFGHAYLRELARAPEFLQGHFLGDELGRAGRHLLATGRAELLPDAFEVGHGQLLPFPFLLPFHFCQMRVQARIGLVE